MQDKLPEDWAKFLGSLKLIMVSNQLKFELPGCILFHGFHVRRNEQYAHML